MTHASTRPTTKCKNVSNVGRVRLNKIANDAGSNSNEAPVLEFLTGAGALGWPKGPCQADVTVSRGHAQNWEAEVLSLHLQRQFLQVRKAPLTSQLLMSTMPHKHIAASCNSTMP